MKKWIEFYTVSCQVYAIPTMKVTHSRDLFGRYSLDFIWLKWGISLMF
jgi:hypothetical protein